MTETISQKWKSYRTEWTALFLAAAELSRRGYIVSFTMGDRTPVADLMVGTPDGRQFWVDVKGHSGINYWDMAKKEDHQNLFYILVTVSFPKENGFGNSDRFFILTQSEANDLISQYERNHPNTKRPAFSFKKSEQFDADWKKLPPVNVS